MKYMSDILNSYNTSLENLKWFCLKDIVDLVLPAKLPNTEGDEFSRPVVVLALCTASEDEGLLWTSKTVCTATCPQN